jgi:hypothetical protein
MTLAYDTAGTGPTVIRPHSSVCDRRMWGPLILGLRTRNVEHRDA